MKTYSQPRTNATKYAERKPGAPPRHSVRDNLNILMQFACVDGECIAWNRKTGREVK